MTATIGVYGPADATTMTALHTTCALLGAALVPVDLSGPRHRNPIDLLMWYYRRPRDSTLDPHLRSICPHIVYLTEHETDINARARPKYMQDELSTTTFWMVAPFDPEEMAMRLLVDTWSIRNAIATLFQPIAAIQERADRYLQSKRARRQEEGRGH